MGGVQNTSAEAADDSSLLLRLREGDRSAYTELWQRHITAALRLGHLLLPSHSEDLVSDSFLAVYHQVAVVGGGPETAFRAYLFTVMRNTAMRWQNEGRKEVVTAELEVFEELTSAEGQDTLDLLEKESTSSELLEAMQLLPERWQRVLWLSEVEEASRKQIAADLGIRPNAVSALYRRARNGLRMNWLTIQIPAELRKDPAHVARLLPRHITDGRASGTQREVNSHLAHCGTCDGLNSTLRADYDRMRKVTLSLAGFLALGGTVPAMAPIASVGGTTAFVGLLSGSAAAAGVGILVAGSLTAGLLTGVIPIPGSGNGTGTTAPTSDPHDQEAGSGSGDEQDKSSNPDRGPSNLTENLRLGVGNTDLTIPVLQFSDSNQLQRPTGGAPLAPVAAQLPGSPTTPGSSLSPGISTPAVSSGYFAPVLSGTTSPGAQIYVTVESSPFTYDAGLAAADGSWTFDIRDVAYEYSFPIGTYEYTAWVATEEETSTAQTGSFTLLGPGVEGFDDLTGVLVGDSAKDNVVLQFSGPPDGVVIVMELTSNSVAMVPLDARGTSLQRLRFLAAGAQMYAFAVFDPVDGFASPTDVRWVNLLGLTTAPPIATWGGSGTGGNVFELSAE